MNKHKQTYMNIVKKVHPLIAKGSNELFHFYIDEGGLLGTTKIVLSSEKVQLSEDMQYVGKMTRYHIEKYIINLLFAWELLKIDYSLIDVKYITTED